MTAPSPMRALDFLDTLGVNLRLGDGDYSGMPRIRAALAATGIKHVRMDSLSISNAGAVLLAQDGARFSVVARASMPPAVVVANVAAILRRVPGCVVQIEGPNEVNNLPPTWTYKGLLHTPAVKAYMLDLQAAMTGEPLTAGMPLLGCVGLYRTAGNVNAVACTVGNEHCYPTHDAPPLTNFRSNFAASAGPSLDKNPPLNPGKPVQFTEFGYIVPTVAPAEQARLALNGFALAALMGVQRTYWFELVADGYGMFTSAGTYVPFTPRPVVSAISNLVTILADQDAKHSAKAPTYSLLRADGTPDTVTHQLLLSRSDGAFLLLLWRDDPTPETVTLATAWSKHVRVFTPETSAAPLAPATLTKAAALAMAGQMFVVEIKL